VGGGNDFAEKKELQSRVECLEKGLWNFETGTGKELPTPLKSQRRTFRQRFRSYEPTYLQNGGQTSKPSRGGKRFNQTLNKKQPKRSEHVAKAMATQEKEVRKLDRDEKLNRKTLRFTLTGPAAQLARTGRKTRFRNRERTRKICYDIHWQGIPPRVHTEKPARKMNKGRWRMTFNGIAKTRSIKERITCQ